MVVVLASQILDHLTARLLTVTGRISVLRCGVYGSSHGVVFFRLCRARYTVVLTRLLLLGHPRLGNVCGCKREPI